jgi:Phosphofructokinase
MDTSANKAVLIAGGAFVVGVASVFAANKLTELVAAKQKDTRGSSASAPTESALQAASNLQIRPPPAAQQQHTGHSFVAASPAAVGATTDASPRARAPPTARKDYSPVHSTGPSDDGQKGDSAIGLAVSPKAAGLENPWMVSTGDKGFEMGHVHDTGLQIDALLMLDVPSLKDLNPEQDAKVPNHKRGDPSTALNTENAGAAASLFDGFISFTRDDSVVIGDIVRSSNQFSVSRCYLRAGPRASLYFKPSEVRAAIVTCGGLCPGLNNVIREVTNTLHNIYGVKTVYGLKRGYWAFHDPLIVGPEESKKNPSVPKEGPMLLTPKVVEDIHHQGGTFLSSDRGGDSSEIAIKFIKHYGINQLYVLGGDGTARGADQIFRATQALKMPVVVCHLPKTIDNDIGVLGGSSGHLWVFANSS